MAKLNNCFAGLFLPSSNTHVVVGSQPTYNFTPLLNAFSFGGWFKTSVDPPTNLTNLSSSSAVPGKQWLIAKGGIQKAQYGVAWNGVEIEVHIGGTVFLFDAATNSITPSDNGWHFVVVTASTTQCILYYDGNQIGSTKTLVGNECVPADLLIGGIRHKNNATAFQTWDGYLDEVAIWNSALAANEITALYNSGNGIDYSEDSGNYVSSSDLKGWWKMGDGITENAGGVPTGTIYDGSGGGNHGTLSGGVGFSPNQFYQLISDGPGSKANCNISSSSVAGFQESFTIQRQDEGNLQETTGFEGDIHRMRLRGFSTPNADKKIFVHEMGRVIVGMNIRRPVFRRVATLQDLVNIPEDTPGTQFPFAYRTDEAMVYANSTAKLDAVWLEVQRQAATLSLDIKQFGAPNDKGQLRGGLETLSFVGSKTFEVRPPGAVIGSSSTVAQGSSSSSVRKTITTTSSSIRVVQPSSSSSSRFVLRKVKTTRMILASDTKHSATRLTDTGVNTLFNDLGFVRFGRDSDPNRTWDTFLRFRSDQIPKCAEITSARLYISAYSTETGEDVIVKLHDIYKNSAMEDVDIFTSANDPAKIGKTLIWRDIRKAEFSAQTQFVDVRKLLQNYINRGSYMPSSSAFFGLWIKELASDPGARRDSYVDNAYPYIDITYMPEGECPSSSSSFGGV